MKAKLKSTSKLKEIRESLDMTQQEMSEYIATIIGRNMSKSMYQKIEQGRETVTPNDALQISRTFNVGINELWKKP